MAMDDEEELPFTDPYEGDDSMTIENAELFVAGLWDWACLDGCFVGSIRPTDIDGFIEYNGQFLMLETKQPGVEIPKGQAIMFNNWVDAGNSVLIIWGTKNNPKYIRLMTPNIIRDYDNADIERLRTICKKWFTWAGQQQPRKWGTK